MEKLTTVGIDLAKDVIALCGLDVHGAAIERRVLRREAFERWAGQLPMSRVVMEASGSAHHWGRWLAARGHSARLVAAEFVVPLRKGGKNDTADAVAIAVAAGQLVASWQWSIRARFRGADGGQTMRRRISAGQ